MNLLYVEDNLDLAQTVRDNLGKWFNVDIADNCSSGLKKADSTEYDVIIVDFFLPDGYGTDLCRQIRQTNQESLILFLSQNEEKNDIVRALNIGADDYLTKPFNFSELKARIQALIRRKFTETNSHILYIGDLTLDQKKMQVFYKGELIKLKRKEFLLLEYLMLHRGQVVSRPRLYEHVWNQQYYSSNTVDVHIKRLRNKIEVPYKIRIIRTVYGIGYQLEPVPVDLEDQTPPSSRYPVLKEVRL